MSLYRSPSWEFPENPALGEVQRMVRSLRKPELYKFAVECLRMGSVRKADLKARILSSVLDEVQRIALHSGSTSITLQVSRAEMLRGLQTIMYQQRDSTRGRRARADFSRNFMMDDISRLAGLMGPGGGLSSGLTAPPRLPDRDFICNICHGGCSYPRCPSCGSFTHHACAALFSRYAVRGCLTCRLTQAAKADIYNLNFPRGGVLHHASPLYMVNIDGQISTLRAAGSHAGRILSESIRIPSTDDGRIFLATFSGGFQSNVGHMLSIRFGGTVLPVSLDSIFTEIPSSQMTTIHTSLFSGRLVRLLASRGYGSTIPFFFTVVRIAGEEANVASLTLGLNVSTPARLQRARATGTAAEHEKKLFEQMEEQMVVREVIPLSCPLTMNFLKNPCRGQKCAHATCFEFEALCDLYKLKFPDDSFSCPICQCKQTLKDVYVDKFVEQVVTDIQLHKYTDGTFNLELYGEENIWCIDEDNAAPAFEFKQKYSHHYRVAYAAALKAGGDESQAVEAAKAAIAAASSRTKTEDQPTTKKASADDSIVDIEEDHSSSGGGGSGDGASPNDSSACNGEAGGVAKRARTHSDHDNGTPVDPFAGWDDPRPELGTVDAPIELF